MIIFSLTCLLVAIVWAVVDTKLVYCRSLGTVYNIFWGNLKYRILGQLVMWSTVFLFAFLFHIRSIYVNYLELGGLISADRASLLRDVVEPYITSPVSENCHSLSPDTAALKDTPEVPDYVRALWEEKQGLPKRYVASSEEVYEV